MIFTIGGGPRSKIGVGGESSGGKIAASVAHDVSDIAFQVHLLHIRYTYFTSGTLYLHQVHLLYIRYTYFTLIDK